MNGVCIVAFATVNTVVAFLLLPLLFSKTVSLLSYIEDATVVPIVVDTNLSLSL